MVRQLCSFIIYFYHAGEIGDGFADIDGMSIHMLTNAAPARHTHASIAKAFLPPRTSKYAPPARIAVRLRMLAF